MNRFDTMDSDMFALVDSGDLGRLKNEIHNGAHIDCWDTTGTFTPLMQAIKYGDLDIISILVENGADFNLQNRKGETALSMAIANGNKKIVEYLTRLQRSAKPRYYSGPPEYYPKDTKINENAEPPVLSFVSDALAARKNIVASACLNNFNDVINLAEHGVNVNMLSEKGRSALMYASIKGYLHIVKYLVEHNALIDLQDHEGETALIFATFDKHFDIVKYLVENGASVNLQNKKGNTALMLAIKVGDSEIVKYLIANGADINMFNILGMTCYNIAKEYNPDMLQYL